MIFKRYRRLQTICRILFPFNVQKSIRLKNDLFEQLLSILFHIYFRGCKLVRLSFDLNLDIKGGGKRETTEIETGGMEARAREWHINYSSKVHVPIRTFCAQDAFQLKSILTFQCILRWNCKTDIKLKLRFIANKR